MVYAITGHRPDKINGYSDEAAQSLIDFAHHIIPSKIPLADAEAFYIGMAQGWDQAVAQFCIDSGIPFHAAIPFPNQDSLWPYPARVHYRNLMKHAATSKIVSPGQYSAEKMQLRNQWMVDQIVRWKGKVIAFWDGTPGGTANCVQYAERMKVEVINVYQDYWRK